MTTKTENAVMYERFDLSQRIQHILLILSFTTLALTGLPQMFVKAGWAQGFMSVLGGLDGVRGIHHIAGMLLLFVFVFHFFNVFFDLITRKGASIVPKFQDVKDAMLEAGYLLGRKTEKPQYDKFNFREKLEYWALIWGTFLMGLTGLILMFPGFFTGFMPGIVVYAAKAAHGLEALLAVASIITWHMYNTHFSAAAGIIDTTIFTGKISQERMMEEHPLEYQRLLEKETQTAETKEEDVEASDEA